MAMIFHVQLEFVDIIFRSNVSLCVSQMHLSDNNYQQPTEKPFSAILKQGHLFSSEALVTSSVATRFHKGSLV